MKSAVRWYERALSGELGEYSQNLALDRCVSRAGDPPGSDIALPAGLSAVLRDRPLSSSGVPIGLGMTAATADDEQRPWIDDTLPRSIAAAGSRDRVENPVFAKALMKQVAANEPGVGSSRQGILAGGGKGDTGTGGEGIVVPSKALAVAQRMTSRSGPSDAGLSDSISADPAAPDRLAAVLFGGETRYAADGRTRDVPGTRTVTADAALGVPGFPAAVADRRPEASNVFRMAAVSTLGGGDAHDRYGVVSQAVTAAGRSEPGVVPVGTGASWAPAPGPSRPIDRIVDGQLGGPAAAADLVLAGISEGMADRRFRDPAMQGQDVVPRRAGAPMQGNARMKPSGMVHRAEPAATPAAPEMQGGSGSAARSSTGSGAARVAPQGTVVALWGDVMMDGRKMGRMVATGQTSAASLPTVSGSAINLRALPVFAGTSAAL